MRKINRIIIHCSATPEGRWHDAKDIDRWHKQRGFASIGYHFVVLLDGTVQPGRPISQPGAHARGYNYDSIGVCYVGGLDGNMKAKDTRTPAQKAALRKLIAELKTKYPYATVHGHNEFANKDCPCFDVHQWFKNGMTT